MILTICKKRPQDRNSQIKIDNEVWGVLPDKTLRTFLFINSDSCSLSEEESGLIIKAIENYAKRLLLDYLAKFERSGFQCQQMLQRHGFSKIIVERSIDYAIAYNYLNDSRFAELLITSLIERNASRRQIEYKLRQHHIPVQVSQSLLTELYPHHDQVKIIQDEIAKLQIRYRDLEPYKRKEKILTHLYRKGFDLDLCRDLLS